MERKVSEGKIVFIDPVLLIGPSIAFFLKRVHYIVHGCEPISVSW